MLGFFPFNCDFMAHATKPDNLSSITRIHMGEGGTCPLKLFFGLYMTHPCGMHVSQHIHKPTHPKSMCMISKKSRH